VQVAIWDVPKQKELATREEKMNEDQADAVAAALGGESWQSGGDIWLVVIRRQDGRVVVISDEAVCEYESEEAFDEARAVSVIHLC
jgi:hypothetical protein